jgi:hypothetical protein
VTRNQADFVRPFDERRRTISLRTKTYQNRKEAVQPLLEFCVNAHSDAHVLETQETKASDLDCNKFDKTTHKTQKENHNKTQICFHPHFNAL